MTGAGAATGLTATTRVGAGLAGTGSAPAGTLALTLTATTAAPTAPAALGVRLNDSKRENSVVSGMQRAVDVRRVELVAERPPRAEQQHLHGRDRRAHLLRDLVVREAVDLAEEERLALLGRQRRERFEQRSRLRVRLLGGERGICVERLLARAAE